MCGKELFAYIPGMIYGDSSSGTQAGLLSRLNSNFVHRYLVDATPVYGDVDFKNTVGASGTGSDWRSILVGGLGKGAGPLHSNSIAVGDMPLKSPHQNNRSQSSAYACVL